MKAKKTMNEKKKVPVVSQDDIDSMAKRIVRLSANPHPGDPLQSARVDLSLLLANPHLSVGERAALEHFEDEVFARAICLVKDTE